MIRDLIFLIRFIFKQDMPFIKTLLFVLGSFHKENNSFHLVVQTDWLSHPENYMTKRAYISHSLKLNDVSLRGALMTKSVLFQRMPSFMQRDYLSLRLGVSDLDIVAFINRHHKTIGKSNLSGGKNMRVFSADDKDILEKLKSKKIAILEEVIEQHPEYAAMNASSVNTLRIHTVRTTQGCQVFLYPKLRVGKAGEIVDFGIHHVTSYRVLLDHEGHIISSYKKGKDIVLCEKHEDTGYCFIPGKQLPFVVEAEKLCIEAAAKIPEARYIGWDVAITEQGPVIVEANSISGAIGMYQILYYLAFGQGNGKEIRAMLDSGMENIVYDSECGLQAVRFADLSYIYSSTATPDVKQQFMLLLQSALHNCGIEFLCESSSKANCKIVCDWENGVVKFSKNIEQELMLPVQIPVDIFAADILARDLAKQIFFKLVNNSNTRGTRC